MQIARCKVHIVVMVLAVALTGSPMFGQDEPLDEVSQKASQLEGQLTKVLDTTPEAADMMIKLVDLYHANGRVFGLIRTGQKFITSQPNHPGHRDVMLKLLDGLVATSRNQQIVATARQFLERYPQDKQAAEVEGTLARTLDEMGRRGESAPVYAATWKRLGAKPGGPEAGATAMERYGSLNNAEGFKAAAELADEMLDKLPKGSFVDEVAWQGFHFNRRYNNWAGANLIGIKMLRKGLPLDKERMRQLHGFMAEHYGYQNQHRNAVDAATKSLALGDDPDVHMRRIYSLHSAEAKPDELAAAIKAFVDKYPNDRRRWEAAGLLPYAYQRAGQIDRAMDEIAQVLPHDGRVHDLAMRCAEWAGDDKGLQAKAEKILNDAIGKNKEQAGWIRYALAFSLYRDRMKDEDRSRQVGMQMLTDSPTNEGRDRNAVYWLLDSVKDEGQFHAEFTQIAASVKRHADLGYLRDSVESWIKDRSRQKERKDLAAWAKGELNKQIGNDAYVKAWDEATSNNRNNEVKGRDELIEKFYGQLDDAQAWRVLSEQAQYYRYYAPNNQRSRCVELYEKLAKRFADNDEAARNYVHGAGDHGEVAQKVDAVRHALKREPFREDGDTWRRMLGMALEAKDDALFKQAYEWVLKAQDGSPSLSYANEIGDLLEKANMKDEAMKYWRDRYALDMDNYMSQQACERITQRLEGDAQRKFVESLLKQPSNYHGAYASWLADICLKANDLKGFESVMRAARKRQDDRPFRDWGMGDYPARSWIDQLRGSKEADDATRRTVYTVVRDMQLGRTSAMAQLSLLELDAASGAKADPMQTLLAYQRTATTAGDSSYDWDTLMPFAQSALTRKDYAATATLATAMLNNVDNVDSKRQKSARDMVGQAYSRMGGVGLTIDEDSPLAPLLKAALYLRLGDRTLALDAYNANRELFDQHRTEVPVDLLLFVTENLIAAGGDANHDKAEDVLRSWLLKFGESANVETKTKAQVQLLLARNYYKAGRFEVARSEYQTVISRYADTDEAIDAEFGIGESYMAQKIYDKAEQVFEKLAGARDRRTVIRAEYLRGVLAYRRGDRDEARQIFTDVLERVPDVNMADQALFNLAEVYGDEQRHMDQLELLRTVGRLGRSSKRWHTPGKALSIVVQDSDLGISRGHTKIPVIIKTEPGGDEETVHLFSGGAGKGLFRADIPTRLGVVEKGDGVLQITGKDHITVDYPEEFKKQFRSVPLADADIGIAADAKFEVASSKIVDQEEETFSQKLKREEQDAEAEEQRKSQGRPKNQIKPGNPVYMRVADADRDASDEADKVIVKLVASSGDQVQVSLMETGPHTGLFEGATTTNELPAGALASDNAIDHSPLMAIDHDPASYWISEPDGATPKWLSVDMKDLRRVAKVKVTTPDPVNHAPVRMRLQGSHDGRYWYTVTAFPPRRPVASLTKDFGRMTQRVWKLNRSQDADTWRDLVDLTRNREPSASSDKVEQLSWSLAADDDAAKKPHVVVWSGKLVQPRDGAVRFAVTGSRVGVQVNGIMELPYDTHRGGGQVDVYLPRGLHDVTIVALIDDPTRGVTATRARENLNAERVTLADFRATDFELDTPLAKSAGAAEPGGKPAASAQKPIVLSAVDAKLDKKTDQFGLFDGNNKVKGLGYWQNEGDHATWEFDAPTPGVYSLAMHLAHQGAGSRYIIEFGDQTLRGAVPDTGDWKKFVDHDAGMIRIDKPGKVKLIIRPEKIENGGLMDLTAVTLHPTNGATVVQTGNTWQFDIPPAELRHVRVVVDEYLGEAVAISNVEIAGDSAPEPYIPTKDDVLALASNNVLEIAAGDTVTASYTDEYTTSGQANRLLSSELTATYFNGSIEPIAYDFARDANGAVQQVRKDLMRIDPGERITLEVTDYDMDQSAQPDKVDVFVRLNENGEPIKLTATETEEYTGVFRTEIDTSAETQEGKLAVKPGDRVYLQYVDHQNTFPGHSVPREAVVYVTEPTEGRVRVVETRYVHPDAEKQPNAKAQAVYLPPNPDTPADHVAGVAYEVPLTVEVIDPDAAKDSSSSVVVKLTTTDGATVDVRCVVSPAFASKGNAPADVENWALLEGRFVGQAVMQLGGKDSPVQVPTTAGLPTRIIGGPVDPDAEADGKPKPGNDLVVRVLNISGKDRVTATYTDKLRPDNKPADLAAAGRLIANGELHITDRDYEDDLEMLHVGEKLFLVVTDPDGDVSDDRDKVQVRITSSRGEDETLELEETLTHSGVFTGAAPLKAREKPTASNLTPNDPEIETFFGDTLVVTYVDNTASTDDGKLTLTRDVPVAIGTDGIVAAFSKVFGDEELAVQTQFHIAESYFELFKSHLKLGRTEEMNKDLDAGRRLLRELMEDYPNPKYAPRVAYLLGQFAQELKQWDEAIDAYRTIVRRYPDHTLAADAQYKLAQSYEEAGEINEALEAYVTLAATYPKSPLIPNVMIRINEYFYVDKNYVVAAQVGEKFLERFESHQWAAKMAFRVGQCYYKDEQYKKAAAAFDEFVKKFPDDALAADSLFWAGESYRQGKDVPNAFRRYNRCRWDFPETDAAKYARGRLALPEMLEQFEREARVEEDK